MDSQSPVPSLSLEFSQILAIPRLRRFLAPHAEGSWAEIVKLTLLYGVLALDQCYGRDELSLQEIRQEVERGKGTGEVLQRLPRIRSGVEKLREDLDWIARELDGDQGLAPEVNRDEDCVVRSGSETWFCASGAGRSLKLDDLSFAEESTLL